MGRILILEPQPEVRELFVRVAARLGHAALTEIDDETESPPDAIVLAPEDPVGLSVVRSLHGSFPDVPIVCTSILPRGPETRDLAPVAYLTKPFALADLERVLTDALA